MTIEEAMQSPLDEAARWMARLHRDGSPDWSDPDLARWLAQDELNALALASVAADWHAAAAISDPAMSRLPVRPARPAPMRFRWALAASVVVAAALAWFQPRLDHRWQSFGHEIVAPDGQVTRITLGDGSTVVLAPGSVADPLAESRGLNLIRGEAVFEVVRDPQSPFQVTFEGGRVEVLGTVFGVGLRSGEPRVGVLDGRVRVRAGPEEAVLRPGEAVRIERGSIHDGGFAPEHRFGWRTGRLRIDALPFDQALAELRGFTHRRIVKLTRSDPVVSAVINLDRVDQGIESMVEQAGLRATRIPGGLLIH